jgi:hypothetical protein
VKKAADVEKQVFATSLLGSAAVSRVSCILISHLVEFSREYIAGRRAGHPARSADEEEGVSQYDDDASWYDVMQVCRNGHKVTALLTSHPEHGKQFCSVCGAASVSKCHKCQADIQGYHHLPGLVGGSTPVPAFCHACGSPYPWTEVRLEAARELAQELQGLSEDERQTLKTSLDDLVRDTPRTALAATRFKRVAAKAGKGAVDAFKEVLVGVISEAAKKLIWP